MTKKEEAERLTAQKITRWTDLELANLEARANAEGQTVNSYIRQCCGFPPSNKRRLADFGRAPGETDKEVRERLALHLKRRPKDEADPNELV